MDRYWKDFVSWAKVAERVERRKRPDFVKPGAIYWCNFGVGIGSELVGKGENFTRPVLVLARIDDRLVLVLPITSKEKQGIHYHEIMVNGVIEKVVLYQAMTIDSLRIGEFIDEVPLMVLDDVCRRWLRFAKRLVYKEN